MPQGGARPGAGRKKGGRNKGNSEIQARIESYDPVGQLMELATETDDPTLRAKVLLGVLPYGYARLASSIIDLKAALMGDTEFHLHPPAKGKK